MSRSPSLPALAGASASRSAVRTIATLALLLSFGTTALAAPGSMGPRLMPPYKLRGDVIDDPVRLKQERKEFEAAYEQFRTAAKAYQGEVKEFITREVSSRQKAISASYQGQIDALDQAQFDLRRDAIARLEAFIFRHRSHDNYTPDAMFRLAELYYEDTIASYNRAQDNFQREMDLYNRGKLLDPPSDTDRDFSRSIAIYKYLHWVPEGTPMPPLSGKLEGVVLEKRWPNHKLSDAAMYLQGYCEYESGDADKAIKTLSALEDHYPKSKYVAEAWLRVGEMWFDDNEFEQAAAAYERAAKRAAELNDPRNYSLALYKLGWSNFQLYKYPEAVRWFQQLIEFEDQQAVEAAKSGKKKGGYDLRKEAIEYLAKSLAEPSWDDDGCDDFGSETSKGQCTILDPRLRPRLYVASVLEPKYDDFPNWRKDYQGEVLQRIETNLNARNSVRQSLIKDRPYVFDILVTYGNTLYDQKEDDYYRQAIEVMGYVVDHYPLAREAQELQRKVIRSVDVLAGAAISYQAMLNKNPNDAEARLGLQMAKADQDRQIAERRKYLAMFAKGTGWYDKWGGDKDLAAQVEDTVGKVRLDFAQLIHYQAQTLRAAGDESAALAKYAEASAEYEKLLKADPESPNAYALAWTIAETWFFAGKRCNGLLDKTGTLLQDPKTGELMSYPADVVPEIKKSCGYMGKSIEYYNMVRDWKGQRTRGEDGKPLDYTEEAAFSSILASSLVINARAAYPQGDAERLATRLVPDIRPSGKQDDEDLKAVETIKDVQRVTRLPVDPLVVDWILSVDNYIAATDKFAKLAEADRPQKLALKAAELLYKNRHFDPWPEGKTPKTTAEFWSARDRFWSIVKKYPGTPQAVASVQSLLTSFALERDMAALEAATERIKEAGALPKEQAEKIGKDIAEFKLGQLGDSAKAKFEDAKASAKAAEESGNPDEAGKSLAKARKQFEEAGDLFRKLRSDAPDTKTKMIALMNAMTAFYQGEKWEKCFDVLKEAEEMVRADKDPKEKEENTKRLEKIIGIRAELNYKFFNIADAIADFRLLYQNDPNGPKAAKYLTYAADMAFYNSNWDLAVQLDREIIARFEKDLKQQQLVKDSAWRINQAYLKKGDIPKHIEALEQFIARYQADKATSGKVFKAYAMIAEIYENRGDKKNATVMYNRIIDAFQKGGFEKNGGPEATAAAQSTFMLMRPRYDAYMATKLVENTKLPPAKRGQDLQKQLMAMLDIVLGPLKKTKQPDGTVVEARGGGMYDEYANEVAGYGSQNWSYAAFLYRGKMLQYLARVIYGAPEPEGMSEEESNAYHEILDEMGGQIEKRAQASLEVALKDAEAKGVVNQWVAELRKAINAYKPKEYPLLKDEKRLVADPQGTLPLPDKELR